MRGLKFEKYDAYLRTCALELERIVILICWSIVTVRILGWNSFIMMFIWVRTLELEMWWDLLIHSFVKVSSSPVHQLTGLGTGSYVEYVIGHRHCPQGEVRTQELRRLFEFAHWNWRENRDAYLNRSLRATYARLLTSSLFVVGPEYKTSSREPFGDSFIK